MGVLATSANGCSDRVVVVDVGEVDKKVVGVAALMKFRSAMMWIATDAWNEELQEFGGVHFCRSQSHPCADD